MNKPLLNMQSLKVIGIMFFMLVNSKVHADNVMPGTQGSIVPDISLLTNVCVNGSVFKITGGEKKGSNLFHSFNSFSILTGNTALFSNDQPGTTKNIISRVTGNIRSEIDGIIRADESSGFKNVNFFLLNPAGVSLGSSATLDIDGSVHLTTADYIKFNDGNAFYVDTGLGSTLTTSNASAFGFLKPTVNRTIPSSISIEESELDVGQGETLSLVAGNIYIKGSDLNAPAGQITIVNAIYGEEIPFSSLESIMVDEEHESKEFGEILITAGEDFLDDSFLLTPNPTNINITSQTKDAGSIFIRGGSITIDRSKISANSSEDRNAGNVIIEGKDLSMLTGAKIDVSASGSGITGSVSITTANNVTLSGEGEIDQFLGATPTKITASNSGSQDAGNLSIKTSSLNVFDKAQIITSSSNMGFAGNIDLKVKNLNIDGKGEISASTSNIGNGGKITLIGYDGKIAAENVNIIDGEIKTKTDGSGNGGIINLVTNKLLVHKGGIISSQTSNDGNAGNIEIIAKDQATLSNNGTISSKSTGLGDAGKIDFKISELRLDTGSITTEATQSDGGNITIEGNSPAKLVSLKNNSSITATVNGGPETTGGNINIDSDLIIAQNSQIIANAFEGSGGNINIKTQGLFVDPNSQISASSDRGIDGVVEIDAAIEVIDGVLGLPETYVSNLKLRQETCAKRLGPDKTSSFTIVEKSGMPISPEAMLSADYSNHLDTEKNVTNKPRYIKNHVSTNEQFDINCRNRNIISGR